MALRGKLGTRRLDSHAFGSVFFGLQRMQCRHAEVRSLLTALSAALPPLPSAAPGLSQAEGQGQGQGQGQGETHFLATSYAMAFSGLRLLRDDTEEVAQLLARIHALMVTCPEHFATSSLVNILFGLQSMTAGGGDTVRNILSFVSMQFTRNNDTSASSVGSDSLSEHCALTPPRLGRALYGLQCMSSDVAEVREVVLALASTLEQQRPRQEEAVCFSALDLRRVVGGLRGFSSDHHEVRIK